MRPFLIHLWVSLVGFSNRIYNQVATKRDANYKATESYTYSNNNVFHISIN